MNYSLNFISINIKYYPIEGKHLTGFCLGRISCGMDAK